MVGFGDGSGISWTIYKQSALRSRQITTPTLIIWILLKRDTVAVASAGPYASLHLAPDR